MDHSHVMHMIKRGREREREECVSTCCVVQGVARERSAGGAGWKGARTEIQRECERLDSRISRILILLTHTLNTQIHTCTIAGVRGCEESERARGKELLRNLGFSTHTLTTYAYGRKPR